MIGKSDQKGFSAVGSLFSDSLLVPGRRHSGQAATAAIDDVQAGEGELFYIERFADYTLQ